MSGYVVTKSVQQARQVSPGYTRFAKRQAKQAHRRKVREQLRCGTTPRNIDRLLTSWDLD